MRQVLLVDDDSKSRMGIKVILLRSDTEYKEIKECDDGLEAERMLKSHRFDLVITDMKMPRVDGITFIKRAQRLKHKPKFLVLSGYEDFGYASESLKYGVKEYLLKPVGRIELVEAVKRIDKELKNEERIQSQLEALKALEATSGNQAAARIVNLQIPEAKQDTVQENDKIDTAIRYIHENYCKDIDLCMVSNHVSLNYNYFSNLFHTKTGMRFVEYTNQIRVQRAQELLCYTDGKISDIAQRVGFANPKHFTKVFRSTIGVSPLEYRQKGDGNHQP